MSALLDFLIGVANASEEDINNIGRLARPESFTTKYDMATHFENVLGVDPFNHFSSNYVNRKLDEMLEVAPYSVREQLYQKRSDIVHDVLTVSDNIEEPVLQRILHKVVQNTVGWTPDDNSSSNLDEAISLELYGSEQDRSDEEPEDFGEFDDAEEEVDYGSEETP